MFKSIYVHLIVLFLLIIPLPMYSHMSCNAKNDPFPMFSAMDPQEYLNGWNKMRLSGLDVGTDKKEYFSMALSGFAQNANEGRDFIGNKRNLGDVINNGRFNMIGLILGDIPEGQDLPQILLDAQQHILDGSTTTTAQKVDPQEEFGFFTIPLKYRKKGGRMDMQMHLFHDLGISMQLSVADICQTVTGYIDLTSESDFPNEASPSEFNATNVKAYLMDQLCPIAQAIGLDIKTFHEIALEQVRANAFWRHTFELNPNRLEWPAALLTPFAQVSGAWSPGSRMDPAKAFAAPFGSEYNSAGASGGLDFDFVNTIYIGGEVGWTHFFGRRICNKFIPTSTCAQQGIFPFKTDVDYKPGNNWHFTAKLGSHYFLDRLSFYFQYVMVHHERDHITLINPDPAFKPEVLEAMTSWKSKVANIAFTYDVSPYVGLGFLWQAPLEQKNSYKSTTVLLSVYAIF